MLPPGHSWSRSLIWSTRCYTEARFFEVYCCGQPKRHSIQGILAGCLHTAVLAKLWACTRRGREIYLSISRRIWKQTELVEGFGILRLPCNCDYSWCRPAPEVLIGLGKPVSIRRHLSAGRALWARLLLQRVGSFWHLPDHHGIWCAIVLECQALGCCLGCCKCSKTIRLCVQIC